MFSRLNMLCYADVRKSLYVNQVVLYNFTCKISFHWKKETCPLVEIATGLQATVPHAACNRVAYVNPPLNVRGFWLKSTVDSLFDRHVTLLLWQAWDHPTKAKVVMDYSTHLAWLHYWININHFLQTSIWILLLQLLDEEGACTLFPYPCCGPISMCTACRFEDIYMHNRERLDIYDHTIYILAKILLLKTCNMATIINNLSFNVIIHWTRFMIDTNRWH